MWNDIQKLFSKNPKKLKVARTILELGLCIGEDKKIYCGPIEIPYSKMKHALGVDRRVVIDTAQKILENEQLRKIFTKIKPAGLSFQEIAKQPEFGFGVVEILAEPKKVGIIAQVSAIIAQEGVSIRQILADDPELFPEPKLTIITAAPITNITEKFLKVDGVNSVKIY